MSSIQRFAWPLIVVLAFGGGAALHLASAQESKPKQKWEYTSGAGYTDKNLTQLGDDGWELVAAVQLESGTVLYFKRPK